MTDQEICVAGISDWPEEARPKRLVRDYGSIKYVLWWLIDGRHLEDDTTVALFRDSAILHLGRVGVVKYWHCGHHWHLEFRGKWANYRVEHNDSLLWLADKAIRSLSPASEKETPR